MFSLRKSPFYQKKITQRKLNDDFLKYGKNEIESNGKMQRNTYQPRISGDFKDANTTDRFSEYSDNVLNASKKKQ